MITWMQRHKKWLIITIWISTIAFVGAGFVGWGQYSYGDKAGAVAKVGNIEITQGSLQKSYSRMYAKYNEMFQGNFDEEKAKAFGLQREALNQLTNQALILNLAASYDLRVSNKELLAELQKQEFFFQDGVFNKVIYKESLSRNNLTMNEYETDLRKQLLIQKVFKLLPVELNDGEKVIQATLFSIADKIKYRVLTDENLTVDSSDQNLRPFWETRQHDYMSDVNYEVKYIKQEKVSIEHSPEKIAAHYAQNKTHFKDKDGKILDIQNAHEAIISELNAKATKDLALRAYIAYKKKKLPSDILVQTASISKASNIFSNKILEKISKVSLTSPYVKPIEMDGEYFTFELTKVNPSTIKTFKEAKEEVLPLFIIQEKNNLLLKKANNLLYEFNGKTTDFITNEDFMSLGELSVAEANEFLTQLFVSQKKKGMIILQNKKVVLYHILEQKMLDIASNNQENTIKQIKGTMFHQGLIKSLNNKYETEIFMEGL